MNAWFVLAILLISPAAAAMRSAAYCPELPEGSGLAWKYFEGGDFIGCVAIRESDDARLFGVYVGQHPWFVHDPSRRKARGIVAGHITHWQLPGPGSEEGVVLESQLNLEAIDVDPPLQSIVWVYTSSRDNYNEAFQAIARMRYRDNWLERPN